MPEPEVVVLEEPASFLRGFPLAERLVYWRTKLTALKDLKPRTACPPDLKQLRSLLMTTASSRIEQLAQLENKWQSEAQQNAYKNARDTQGEEHRSDRGPAAINAGKFC